MAFHWKDGWFFERMPTELAPGTYGRVRIYHQAVDQASPDVDIEIDPESWASIIASVSEVGETAHSYSIAKALHGVPSYIYIPH